MEQSLVTSRVQRQRKRRKPTKKPIKVVYISNPMKVSTSASQFRDLVQALTGQDAEFPDPSRSSFSGVTDHQTVGNDHPHHGFIDVPVEDPVHEQESGISNTEYEPLDNFLTPQIIENLSGLSPSSALIYEPSQLDVFRNLDAVCYN